ncbi:MAG: chromate efflux transporter [Rhodospirillum sp.]|nr:chromate efflux transporter [Rhodospirillum sp.]MCF8490365.1 chromate efflux transporter [Rhodospirillum sp.]MCF8501687.1 chromate efflux transporter [Rhodospirillum sp.]
MTPSPPPPSSAPPPGAGTARDVLIPFLVLGVTAFGGPIAHLGYFHKAFVIRRKWLDEDSFASLLALCQFLPGPASSQMGFAIGLRRAGLPGALAAFLGFTLPSALVMALAALGVALVAGPMAQGVLAGLKLVAVAVIADAILGMARSLCPDRFRATLAVGTLAVVLVWPLTDLPLALGQILPLALSGLVAWIALDRGPPPPPTKHETLPLGAGRGVFRLILFAVLLLGLPLASAWGTGFQVFDSLFRAGALVFGGGHVVLPLLQAEVVGAGLVDSPRFLAGYGLAQAMPGPLFTIGSYLGAAAGQGLGMGVGAALTLAAIGTLAIFLPGFLLLLGVLPFWGRLESRPGLRAALAGVNAGVVGLLAAAFWDPVVATSVHDGPEAALAAGAFLALRVWRLPPWIIVLALAVTGGILLAP